MVLLIIKQPSAQPSGAKKRWSEASITTLDAITLDMVTAHGVAKRTRRSDV